mmetsp:Transcript_48686/g.139184  ORF Transcript_48686/g.139184 Transcript_48686/m.139184 type:complete len:328 (+) Transcript_48686:69-1052(+)
MAIRVLACIAICFPCAGSARLVSAAASDEVELLQVALSISSAVRQGRAEAVSSFASNLGFYCAQGPSRLVEAALATFKAAPFGGLFIEQFAKPDQDCASRGYTVSAGEDGCFPGVQTFFKQAGQKDTFGRMIDNATALYGALYGYSPETARLMNFCTCHPQSEVANIAGSDCEALASVVGSWVARDPTDGHELTCSQGPFVATARSLASLKATRQLPLHRFDMVVAANCSARGFPVESSAIHECYPLMKTWTRSKSTVSLERSVAAVGSPAVDRFIQQHSLDQQVFGLDPDCSCLADSHSGRAAAAKCAKAGPAARSPVRDFWDGRH